MFARSVSRCAALLTVIGLLASPAGAATVVVDFFNGGDGFSSTLPADPASPAPGSTLGEQRRASFEAAAAEWGLRLTSNVPIEVAAEMISMSCNASSALLGAAGPTTVEASWSPGPGGSPPDFPATWYHQALANKIANTDLAPGDSDVSATFNSDLDDNDACLAGTSWYYSTTADAAPAGSISFYQTVLHEIAHGVGFGSFVNPSTGGPFLALMDVFSRFLEDGSTGLTWDQMTNGERAASAVDTGDLVWSGELVTAASGILSAGTVGEKVRMYAPNPVQPGSSVSHFDTAAASGSADELMEPFATGNEAFLVTDQLLADLGWDSLCGKGTIDGDEQCDDGNTVDGDGCSILCEVEECYSCDGSEPTICLPETGTPCDDGVSCTTEICNAGVCDSDAAGCTLDYFKLYKTKTARGTEKFSAREVSLVDSFEDKETLVRKPLRLGNPTDKDGEATRIPEAHLACYRIKDAKTAPAQPRFVRRSVRTTNAFGTENLDVLKPSSLCIAAAIDGASAPLPLAGGILDHFKCYKAKPSRGSAKFTTLRVTLVDAFESKQTAVLKPAEICAPVNKDGEGIVDPTGHLVCYRIKDAKTDPRQPRFAGAGVFVTSVFGNESLTALKPDRLCVPSTKQDL